MLFQLADQHRDVRSVSCFCQRTAWSDLLSTRHANRNNSHPSDKGKSVFCSPVFQPCFMLADKAYNTYKLRHSNLWHYAS